MSVISMSPSSASLVPLSPLLLQLALTPPLLRPVPLLLAPALASSPVVLPHATCQQLLQAAPLAPGASPP